MNDRTRTSLLALLPLQLVGITFVLPFYTFSRQDGGLARAGALCFAALAVAALVGVWRRRDWAPWLVLTVDSVKIVADLWGYASGLDRALSPFSQLLNLAILWLLWRDTVGMGGLVTRRQRIFYSFVLALAGMVGFWGLFLPADILRVLPFSVPPLHARFLGSMYLSGATFMVLGLFAREWAEVRVMTPMISIWTGTLGVVSLFHLEAFDWSRVQVWIWFLAYSAFPILAAWIAWSQRGERQPASGPLGSPALRNFFRLFGAVVTLLAVALLLAPSSMATLWPWKIPPVLAHIYGAPFLSYGVGAFLASRRPAWGEVRIVVLATLVFTAGVLGASMLHRALFDFGAPAAWVWFGGFGLATLALALFATLPLLRVSR